MLWARLLSFHESGFLLTASIEQGNTEAETMGLLSEHAYAVLHVTTVRGAQTAGGEA